MLINFAAVVAAYLFLRKSLILPNHQLTQFAKTNKECPSHEIAIFYCRCCSYFIFFFVIFYLFLLISSSTTTTMVCNDNNNDDDDDHDDGDLEE